MSEQTEKVIKLELFLRRKESQWITVKGRTEKVIEEAVKPYGFRVFLSQATGITSETSSERKREQIYLERFL